MDRWTLAAVKRILQVWQNTSHSAYDVKSFMTRTQPTNQDSVNLSDFKEEVRHYIKYGALRPLDLARHEPELQALLDAQVDEKLLRSNYVKNWRANPTFVSLDWSAARLVHCLFFDLEC